MNLIKCRFHLIYDDRLSYGYFEICVTTTEFAFLCVDFGWRTFYFMEDLFMGTLLMWICLIPALTCIYLSAVLENLFLQFLCCIIGLGLCILGVYLYNNYITTINKKKSKNFRKFENFRILVIFILQYE